MNCPHCETEIDEHEANRCLDAWVTEAVFDLSVERVRDGRMVEEFLTLKGFVPLYSTDIAAAWEVFEKLTADSFFPGVGFEENTWDAWVFREEPIEGQMGSHVKARHLNARLAMCRAALKAVYVGDVEK